MSKVEYIDTLPSPVGDLFLASDGEHLTGLWIAGQKYFQATLDTTAPVEENPALPVFGQTRNWLKCYFAGRNPGAAPPLKPYGTPFRQRVWDALGKIPYGGLSTYGAIAASLGTSAPRAIGGAVGHNPISIIIPCHRVIGADGSLTGYAGGVDIKRKLLALEVQGSDVGTQKHGS